MPTTRDTPPPDRHPDRPPPLAWPPADAPAADLWVFGYGSLMWDPGFPYVEACRARLSGYHRAFCMLSIHYRGTPERPGLVLGLDAGGACVGRAFRLAREGVGAVRHYLWRREMITGMYDERLLPVTLTGGSGATPRRAIALTYVVDRHHYQYAGKLSPAEQAARIAAATGQRGRNADYLANTVAHLDDLGIADGPLHALDRMVNGAAN